MNTKIRLQTFMYDIGRIISVVYNQTVTLQMVVY